ncbi:MAG: ABC transporter substrate-binding protein [Polyangiaceae bacterium]
MRSIRARAEAFAAGLALAAAVALFAPLGCDRGLSAPIPAAGGDDAPRRGGTLHLASFADLRGGLDPAGNVDGLSLAAIHLMFAGLVDYDVHGRVVPELAERWEVADAGRTYRFFMRTGVRMHDGEELTADDVKRSVERALNPSTPDGNATYFTNLEGYGPYAAGNAEHLTGVVVESRYVVAFHLVSPDSTFPYLLALHTLRPTCKSAGDRYSDTWLPCGAGPFKLLPGGWQRGTSLRLVRHDEYFRPGEPYLDAVEWTYNMKPVAQRLRFESGDLDLARELTQADVSRFLADPRWARLAINENDTRIYGEAMNTRIPPFDNVEIRRAVAAAIDREHYVLIQPSRMSPLLQALPGALAEVDPSFPAQRYDYAAALEHMREAGYPYDPATGKGGWPEPVDYLMYDLGIPALSSQLLQQDLAKIGIRLRLKMVSWAAFLAIQQREGGVAMSQGNWDMDYPDPSAVFDKLFTTESISPEGSLNPAFYSNPRLDEIVARAHLEVDESVRKALYREANAIVCDEAPWAFTFGYHFVDVRQPYVRGFAAHPVWTLDVSHVWLDRAGQALDHALGGGLR